MPLVLLTSTVPSLVAQAKPIRCLVYPAEPTTITINSAYSARVGTL